MKRLTFNLCLIVLGILTVCAIPGCQGQTYVDVLAYYTSVFTGVTRETMMWTLVGDPAQADPETGLSGLLAEISIDNITASDACLKDMRTFLLDFVLFGKTYAAQMVAAWTTIPVWWEIAFTGNLQYLPNHELCAAVKKNPEIDYPMQAQVCSMSVPLDPIYNLGVGLCLPERCSTLDLRIIFTKLLAEYDVYLKVGFTCVGDVPMTWDTIFVWCILSLFAFVLVIGTTYHLVFRKRRLADGSVPITAVNLANTNSHSAPATDNVYSEPTPEGVTTKDQLPPDNDENHTSGEVDAEKGVENGGCDDSVNDNHHSASNEMHPMQVIEVGVMDAKKTKENDMLDRILMSFSVISNGSQVLSGKKTKSNLGALNGIRVLSMFWIIWYHCYYFVIYSRLENPNYLFGDIATKFWFRITFEAPFAVDSFFMLSALLVTYLTLGQLTKSDGRLNWVLFYVHRFIRLTPVYMVAMGIWTSLLIHIGSGTSKQEFFSGSRYICQQYWWTNFLYINNLYPYPGSVNLCMGWTWYLANDMQLYCLMPIFILLLFREKTRRFGYIAIAGVTMASCIITAGISGYWGLSVGNSGKNYNNRTDDFPADADRIYAKPWCRIQAYTVGILVGYLIFRLRGRNFKIPLLLNLLGWILAIGAMTAVVFAMYGTSSEVPLPQWFAATWLGTRRFFFAAGVGWVAFACVTGNGGPINAFLSWSFWLPLARLNYCAYLLHPCVIFHFLYTKKVAFHWTGYEAFYFTLSSIVATYGLSLVISLLVEVPTVALEKVLLKRPSRK